MLNTTTLTMDSLCGPFVKKHGSFASCKQQLGILILTTCCCLGFLF